MRWPGTLHGLRAVAKGGGLLGQTRPAESLAPDGEVRGRAGPLPVVDRADGGVAAHRGQQLERLGIRTPGNEPRRQRGRAACSPPATSMARPRSPFRTPSCPARAPRIRRGVPGVGGLPAERSGSEPARSAGAAAPRRGGWPSPPSATWTVGVAVEAEMIKLTENAFFAAKVTFVFARLWLRCVGRAKARSASPTVRRFPAPCARQLETAQ